jgi:hypothetical protein
MENETPELWKPKKEGEPGKLAAFKAFVKKNPKKIIGLVLVVASWFAGEEIKPLIDIAAGAIGIDTTTLGQ